jgi:hypothetical protein
MDWYELFRSCTKITTIKATGQGTSGILRSLAPLKSTNTPSGSRGKKKKWKRNDRATKAQATNNTARSSRTTTTAVPFSELTSLLLENIHFGDNAPYSSVLGDVMINVLRRRKTQCKTPVKALTLHRCVITTHCAKGMKMHVEDFSWDRDDGLSYLYDWEDYGYPSDLFEIGARLEDFFPGTAQAEWEWSTDYSDGY